MSETRSTSALNSASLTPASRFVMIIVGSTAYFGLAVLGWGGVKPFFSHPPLVALAFVTAILVVVSFFAGGNLSSGVREDRGNRWVLTAFAVIGLLDGFLPAISDRREFWTIDGDATRWAGVVLALVGGLIRIWPVFVLGNRFSGLVAIQPEHRLVTARIYGVIRHPSYLGMLLNSLGWGLAFRAGAGVLLTALIVLPLLARSARKNDCSVRTSAMSTMPTAPAHRGSSQDSTEPYNITKMDGVRLNVETRPQMPRPNFLANQRKDLDRAEELYQRALAADPNHPVIIGNYSEFLLLHRPLKTACDYLNRIAYLPSFREMPFIAAAILWMIGVTHAQAGKATAKIIGALKTIVTAPGYASTWKYDDSISWVRENLSNPEDATFWVALSCVCEGLESPSVLYHFPRWGDAAPLPPEAGFQAT